MTIGVRSVPGYGRLLVDGQGKTLYLFTIDRPTASRCTGACARAWPPLIVPARPRAGRGIQDSAVGTLRRADGTLQATIHGHALYYFRGDTKAGDINCQDAEEFGGHWWLVTPNGDINRATG
jgi:predicted lipoprotein with Yx(FWY)xxD motif